MSGTRSFTDLCQIKRIAFQSFDDNGDGWIDNDELRRGFVSFGLGDLDDPDSPMAPFKRLVESCDDNGDGKINYKEFLELAGFKRGRGDLDRGKCQQATTSRLRDIEI